MKFLTVGLALLAVVFGISITGSKRALAEKQAVIARLTAQVAELEAAPQPALAPPNALSSQERSELLRLRAEVTQLRAEMSRIRSQPSAAAARPSVPELAPPAAIPMVGDRVFQSRTNAPLTPHDEAVRVALNQKEHDLQAWWKAFKTYAAQNNGELPTDLAEATAFLPADFDNTIDVVNFMRPNPGSPRVNLQKLDDPKRTVLFKERAPLVLSDGLVCNVYLFADGSVEVFQE